MWDLECICVNNTNKCFGYRFYLFMKIMNVTEEHGSQEERLEARKLKPRSTAIGTGASTLHQKMPSRGPEVILRET